MKRAPTVASQLQDIRSIGLDLQNASGLLEMLMDAAPAKASPDVRAFMDRADWLSQQIEAYAGRIVALADEAELAASRGPS
jgi:hypothetical protein